MRPSTRIKVGLRAALRRRYGFAALRVLRRALRRALADHRARTLGGRRYAGDVEAEAIRAAFRYGVRRLRRRWPSLSFTDERAEP